MCLDGSIRPVGHLPVPFCLIETAVTDAIATGELARLAERIVRIGGGLLLFGHSIGFGGEGAH